MNLMRKYSPEAQLFSTVSVKYTEGLETERLKIERYAKQ
jgi:hypothetical protein